MKESHFLWIPHLVEFGLQACLIIWCCCFNSEGRSLWMRQQNKALAVQRKPEGLRKKLAHQFSCVFSLLIYNLI